MNNSLAPIKSLAASLESLLRREALPPDWKADASAGLNSIASRGDSLDRPLQAYRSLTKLSPPQTQGVDLRKLVRQVVDLEPKLRVKVTSSPKTVIRADAAQVEQALINLVHHAVDASLETTGKVAMGWREKEMYSKSLFKTNGPGL
jgi:two-component system nitrogen regulation sensor histidine kinase NtrY